MSVLTSTTTASTNPVNPYALEPATWSDTLTGPLTTNDLTVTGSLQAEGLRTTPSTASNAITGATTLVNGDSGGTFSVAQSSAYAITLPTPVSTEGLVFNFYLTSPGAFNVTISPAAGSFVGTIINDTTSVIPATGGTLTFASGVSALGDNIEIRSVGGLYLVRAVTSAAGGITVA